MSDEPTENDFKALEPMGSTPVPPALGVAALALNLAMKYHDINVVKDGVLYQQYKMEGKNLVALDLAMVFDTAIQIERHLVQGNQRIADLLVEALEAGLADAPPIEDDEQG